ncbi:MAG: glyoxalase [Frankiales bacterium]|jgi:catechol 2,3-dioxygenase-like lactoylglutathione lyase family enzyme|nr:glyoxalase [Frankiales bacterium]
MRQNVQIITVAAKDLAVSRAFYSDGLGWTPTLDLEEIVFYQVGPGLLFALFPLLDFAADVGAAITNESGFSLGYVVATPADVDVDLERARAAGAKILKDAQDSSFGGYHGYFADPDGHRWEIAWHPGFSVAEDGTVAITA